MPSVTFSLLASLLLPVDRRQTGMVVEADRAWRFDPAGAAGAEVVVWGREPLASGTRRGAALRSAAAREAALRRLRRGRPRALPHVEIHRLPPPRLGGGGLRNRIRDAALGGAIVEMAAAHRPDRIIDAVSQSAGCGERISRFRAGSGGSALARIRPEAQAAGLLRAGMAGSSADPSAPANALEALEASNVPLAPALLARGAVAGASWMVESILPGRRPRKVGPELAMACARFCAALPVTPEPPSAFTGDLAVIAANLPDRAEATARVASRIQAATSDGPGVARHGDFWLGNLLAEGDTLTGITDWDAWHPSSVPGTDLLHLVASGEAHRTRLGVGQVWLRRPWTIPKYRSVSLEYWQRLGLQPGDEYLEAVGLAWWAGQVAGSISRMPNLAEDTGWVTSNIDTVLGAVSG